MAFTILVTGANGQLGNELRILSNEYTQWQFLFTDVEELDITSKTALTQFFQTNKINYIINCAAYTAVDKAEQETDFARKINKDAVKLLGQMATQYQARLLHVSTDYVFDGTAYCPYREDDETNPTSAYGRTKLEGEKSVYPSDNVVVVRTSWLYSEFGNNFVKTVLRLADSHPQLRIVADQVGTPTYAYDLAKALLQIIEHSETSGQFQHGIYHFSNEGVASWYDFAITILEIAGIEKEVIPIRTEDFPTPATRPFYSVLDKTKIKTNFNLSIPHWKQALTVCMKNMEVKK